MVGDANRRARRALAVAIVGCGVFGLQALPTAVAAKGGVDSTASSSGEGASAAAAARRAEREAAKAERAPAPSVSGAPSAEASLPPAAPLHGHRGQSGSSPAPTTVQGTGAGAGAGTRKGDHPAAAATRAQHREERREARRSTSTSATTGSGASPAVAVAGDESAAGQAEAFAHKQKKGGGGGKGKKAKEKGKKPQEEGSGGEGSAEGSSGANAKGKGALTEAAPFAQASATSASPTPAAVAPALGIAPASLSSAPPTAANAGLVGAKRAGRRAARRARKSSPGASAAAAVATPVSPLLATHSGASAAAPSRASHKSARHSRQRSTQPALVRTLTKIVGVVPTPVRILIGALILLASMLGVRSLLSGVRTRRLVRQRGQLLEDVGLLQAALLPVPPARLGPVATSVAYRPADGPGAGGDFYDVFALEDGEIAVIVGDVSGHGREALPHTALVRFTVRAYLEAGLSPRKALQTAGNVLDRQLAGSFATVVAATYNPRERKLTYASAGHPPPVVLDDRRDAGAEALAGGEDAARALPSVTSCSAPPIGAGMRTGMRQTVASVPGPARLCFHTDGVTEARIGDDLFGAERLAAALSGLPPDADAAALLDRVAERSDARPDDMAACLLRVHDGHGASAIVLEQLECNRELLAGDRVERFLLDCGVELGRAEALVRDARRQLERCDSVMLELATDADGRPIASLVDDNVIHAAALATAGAS